MEPQSDTPQHVLTLGCKLNAKNAPRALELGQYRPEKFK